MSNASCRLSLKVIAGAPRDEIAGELGGFIRVRVRAPAVDGRANAAVLALLGRRLGVPASDLRIVAGASTPRKIVACSGLDAAEARRRLLTSPQP